MWGWKHYASVLHALGSPQATAARRTLDHLRET
jgi:hypothetical protein